MPSLSYWAAHEPLPTRVPLDADTTVDVCLVGGGVAGLTVAYHLACEGRRVLVLDDGALGGGETARTTAHLSDAFDDGYARLERLVGAAGTRQVAASHRWAIDRIEQIVRDEEIACDFARIDGFLALGASDDAAPLRDELAASRRAGLTDVCWADEVALLAHGVGRGRPALRYPRQAQVDPLRYLAGLITAIERRGGRVHGGTRVTRVAPHHVVTAAGHRVRCDAVVIATFAPSLDDAGPGRVDFSSWQPAYRTYVVAARVPRGALPFVQLWDTDDPYHYVRLHRPPATTDAAHDVLMVGGEDHKAGQGGDEAEDYAARYARLERWMRDRFPMAAGIEARWSGQLMEPIDYLACIGPHPAFDARDGIHVVTGDSGHGITHAAIAGRLLASRLAGRAEPWADVYDPARLARLPHDREALAAFVRENENVRAMRAGAPRLTSRVVDGPEAVAPGEGAIVAGEAGPLAVHRDLAGVLHVLDARCPHRGCTVGWNPGEGTWDCPCHGSRFDASGRVIDGPAGRDLAPR